MRLSRALVLLGAVTALAAAAAFFRGFALALAFGTLAFGLALIGWWRLERSNVQPVAARRRFLRAMGMGGLGLVVGGTAVGRTLRRLSRPEPRPILEEMARGLGAEVLELIRRGFHPRRSGDLQLVLAPGCTSNYASESEHLLPKDPRSSHALVWNYVQRVPIVVFGPGIVAPADSIDRVSLADLAPTVAHLMGFDDFHAADGVALPGITRPASPPRVIVIFVIDGGGWNVLDHWPTAWPNLKRVMARGATYRNALMGSFPAVTASAHATIGTGAFPRAHGITGHNVRGGGGAVKAYGVPGTADPSYLLVPTLADRWVEHTDGAAWVGEIGYQIWHLGMLGRGGLPRGDKPVAVYWDDRETGSWRPQNPELYRVPKRVPPLSELERRQAEYPDPHIDDGYAGFAPGLRAVCCSPPIIAYQGDLIGATFESEAIGRHTATDLLFINYKAPDYTGHIYNMLSKREEIALRATDEQLGRVVNHLAAAFAPGEYVVIVTADHGQCPTVETMGGVRVDPIQLQADIEHEFAGSIFGLVESVVPSEIYLDERALWDLDVSRNDVAAFLRDYRYRDDLGPYVPDRSVERDHLDARPFAAALSTDFIAGLRDVDLSSYGRGLYVAHPLEYSGIPPVTWSSTTGGRS